MTPDCEDRTCGQCARCADATMVFRIIAEKKAGKPPPRVGAIAYDTPLLRLIKRDADFGKVPK